LFNPNLIIIKDNENILGIYKIKFDYTKEDYKIVILNSTNEVIFNGKLNDAKFIKLDINLGNVYIEYFKPNENTPFFEEEINLKKYSDNFSDKKDDMENLTKKVQHLMDNPEGSTEEIEYHTMMLKRCTYNIEARSYVEEKIKQILLKNGYKIEIADILSKQLYANLYGMGILQELDDDLNISEIMVNAYSYPNFKCNIYYKKTNEEKKKYNKTFNNIDEMLNIFSRTISFSKKELNSIENAKVEVTRANGDRVTVIIPEASEDYVLNIRKFSNFIPTKNNMIKVGTINEEIDELMDILVKGKVNIGIGGEMDTGKTTFINYLLTHTNPLERKTIISNVKEINSNRILDGHDIVFLNIDEKKGFTFKEQIKTALRTTAGRIIIPEARGEEFKQVYEANLKIKGNIFTVHATDDEIFLDTCADMYIESSNSDISLIKNKIAKSIDIIIIMKEIKNKIRIKSISEVIVNENGEYAGLNRLYYWSFEKNKYIRENKISEKLKEKLFEEGVSKCLLNKI